MTHTPNPDTLTLEPDFAARTFTTAPAIVEVRPLTEDEIEWVLIWNEDAEIATRSAYVLETGDVVTYGSIDDETAPIRYEITIFRPEGGVVECGSIECPIVETAEVTR